MNYELCIGLRLARVRVWLGFLHFAPQGLPPLSEFLTLHAPAFSGPGDERRDSGDDSTRAPPLPIPNREVKPCNADGTAKAGEQVIAVLSEGLQKCGPFFVFTISVG